MAGFALQEAQGQVCEVHRQSQGTWMGVLAASRRTLPSLTGLLRVSAGLFMGASLWLLTNFSGLCHQAFTLATRPKNSFEKCVCIPISGTF